MDAVAKGTLVGVAMAMVWKSALMVGWLVVIVAEVIWDESFEFELGQAVLCDLTFIVSRQKTVDQVHGDISCDALTTIKAKMKPSVWVFVQASRV